MDSRGGYSNDTWVCTGMCCVLRSAGASGPAAAAGGAKDEFENELTRELVTEVRELRGLFDAYLEQLQVRGGWGGGEGAGKDV